MLCDFWVSVCFATIYINSNDNIFKKCSFCVCSCSLFRRGCSRWTWRVIVLSTCPLYPRDETVLPLLRIPGWRWLGGWTLTRKSNGEHGSSDSGPGPELFLHRDCSGAPAAYPLEFLGRSSRGGLRTSCFSCCDARRAQVWSSPSLAEEPVFYFVRRWFRSWT